MEPSISRLIVCFMLSITLPDVMNAQELEGQEEVEIYVGKYLGKLNSYHHQVQGEVYAVDAFTFFVKDFTYDGNGKDAFFWAGSNYRPGLQGFIVPNEYGRTNVLDRYLNKDITLTLPDKKKMTEIKWLAVFDLTVGEAFGDVYIPEGFEPPGAQVLSELSRRSNGVRSGPIEIRDSKTIAVPDFHYDGQADDAVFLVGKGPQPHRGGSRVPDENGYLTKLRRYTGEDVVLLLPGEINVFEIDWVAVYDFAANKSLGSVVVPSRLNVPPSLLETISVKSDLINCEQLHRDLQVRWGLFGPQLTIELVGLLGAREYMAFGISGSGTESQMIGGDVALAYFNDQGVAYVQDYNLTAKQQCSNLLNDRHRGACTDEVVGGVGSYQILSSAQADGLNTIRFRRPHADTGDNGDQPFPVGREGAMIWAMGKLDDKGNPTFHRAYNKETLLLQFDRPETDKCQKNFVKYREKNQKPWGTFRLTDPSVNSFNASLGPPGMRRGYEGITGQTPAHVVWYINGYLSPEIYLERGKTYKFRVRGGNQPHQTGASFYHPFIITDEPHGGYGLLTDEERQEIRTLAGVTFTRRGLPGPVAAGPLCMWRHNKTAGGHGDRRLDDEFPSFKAFRNSLSWFCERGAEDGGAMLQVTPNVSWPDTVYYNSYTTRNMGWRIRVVDDLGGLVNLQQQQAPNAPSAASSVWERTNFQGMREKNKNNFPLLLAKSRLEWKVLKNGCSKNPSQWISSRCGHASCLVDDQIFVYGGLSSLATGYNDLWSLDLTERRWSRIPTAGNQPLPKGGATLLPRRNSLILLGGFLYYMIRSPENSDLVLPYQGYNLSPCELHVFDRKTQVWHQWTGNTKEPVNVCYHSATIHRDEMVVFGGQKGTKEISDELWCFNFDDKLWRRPARKVELWPAARCVHSQLELDHNHLLILGGYGGPNRPLRDAWLLETRKNQQWLWHEVTIENTAPPGVWCRPFTKIGHHAVVISPCDECCLHGARFVDKFVSHRHRTPDHEPSSSVNSGDRNVNGQYGSIRASVSSPSDTAPVGVKSPSPSSKRPNAQRNAQLRLESLRRYEQWLLATKKPKRGEPRAVDSSTCCTLHVLDVSRVVREKKAVWLENHAHSRCAPGPTHSPRYSFHCGRNRELIVFGGLMNGSELMETTNDVFFGTVPCDVVP
ncbi:unnamed protein product [Notodromas monacha]|uniref:Uncharacterized protein n=1 Tax=Notodromas monacha TaxID=399045 RepID=A0A7R9BTA1_9CRUS|nr:unnamed protein product [Notodromas monacha]CAG0919956.1 unnamed protein product [Notodromas monacha]